MRNDKHNPRVPVVASDGEPLMTTRASRARRWIKEGKAIPKRTKTGIFYIQLTREPSSRYKQKATLAIDIGSKFDGYAVSTEKDIVLTGMLELPTKVAKKMEQRRNLRRNRRYRKTRRRKPRFNNRKRENGWIAPSQLSKVQTRISIIKSISSILPITHVIIEEVRFNHYRNRYGRYFSTAEIGKTKLRNWIRTNITQNIDIVDGLTTYELREKYNIRKIRNRSIRSIYTHAIDALVHLIDRYNLNLTKNFLFYVWRRINISRRQLHLMNYSKGGIRRKYGGTKSLGLTKGTIVKYIGNNIKYHNKIFRIGGSSNNRLSIHTNDLRYRRLSKNVRLSNISPIYHTYFLCAFKTECLQSA